VALLAAIPFVDAGVAVILFTIIVKLILFPLSKKSVKTQLVMKDIQPEIDQIKEKCKGNKQEEAVKTMALYKEKGVNPFSGILLVILQIPIIFALYFIFLKGGLPKIDTSLLYSFVPIPATVNMNFLGLLDISKANAIAAILVGLSQFFQFVL
jgi:YidC/Oxa1 family membrane protein insertase